MVNTGNDKPAPNCTQDTFTTNSGTINNNLQYRYDFNQNFNFNSCWYLLPCGLCMKTDKPCPKYSGQGWQPYIIYTNSLNSDSQPNNINENHTFTTGDSLDD